MNLAGKGFVLCSLLQDMVPHCIHGVLLLVERDLTFRMEKPTAAQVMEPFIQELPESAWYLVSSLNNEYSVHLWKFILTWNLPIPSLYLLGVVSQVWYLWGCSMYANQTYLRNSVSLLPSTSLTHIPHKHVTISALSLWNTRRMDRGRSPAQCTLI